MIKVLSILAGVFVSMSVVGQMPHEVLLLVNRQSQPSLKVANAYVAARLIPPSNVIYLDIPESVYGGTATISPEQFTKLIWEPANAAARQRGIDSHILAWVYSVDFPIRVKTDDNDRRQMSVCGLTFMRNKIPDLSLIEDGKYQSRLFAGPNDRLQRNLPSLSFRSYRDGVGEDVELPEEVQYLKEGLGKEMPLPNMMLGYIGEKGNDVQTVLDTIKRGAQSDYRGKRSGIYFVISDDVRSTCREWQYYPVVNELKERGLTASVTTNFPAGEKNVMGVMMGAETVDPSAIGSFAPGAMAEHLTSWSADFQKRQTKMTDWLKAGATASAGTVVEPYSNPNKFPSARFYVHYAAGCTMLESFYQSIACPLQILLLGDPLAKPYGFRFSLKLMGADTIDDDFTFVATAESRLANPEYLYCFMIDGKMMRDSSANPSIWLQITALSDGYHELRATARPRHGIDFWVSTDKPIMVTARGRSIELDLGSIQKTGQHTHVLKVKVGGAEQPEKVRLVSGARVLDEKEYAEDVTLTLDEMRIGEGPTRIQAVAIYPDAMAVASPPIPVTITFAP